MVRGLLARGRAVSACLCVAAAAALGGCGTAGSSAVTISGTTLTIYASAPKSLSSDPQAQDVIDAELLAFHSGCTLSSPCAPIHMSSLTIDLKVVRNDKVSSNARTAIEDDKAVAYLGEVQPGASVGSLGITNAQQLLQVSPAEGASVPTSDFESFGTYKRTFASMAPNQDAQALNAGSAGKAFARDFRGAFGHTPSSQAILGYAATAAVLKALQNAGSGATNRGTIRTDFFALKNVPLRVGSGGPELGTYTVSQGGTVTITPAPG